jgi:hypothetical protein
MKNFDGALVEPDGLGCRYQTSSTGRPVKQRFAKLQLKRLERAGYRGLRHMQALRRIHDAAALDHRHQKTQVLYLHLIWLWVRIKSKYYHYIEMPDRHCSVRLKIKHTTEATAHLLPEQPR